MPSDRFLTAAQDEGLERLRRDMRLWWTNVSRPIRVRFLVADVPIDVRHELGYAPDGFLVLDADATIIRAPGFAYTPTLAYLQADRAPSAALLLFVRLSDVPTETSRY